MDKIDDKNYNPHGFEPPKLVTSTVMTNVDYEHMKLRKALRAICDHIPTDNWYQMYFELKKIASDAIK